MTTELTLDEMKAFDCIQLVEYVRDKLLAQGKKSLLPDCELKDQQCAYRGGDGCRCAAGWLIPDDLYDSEFEGSGWMGILHIEDALQFSTPASPFKDRLIEDMQEIHDWRRVEEWETCFNLLIKDIERGKYGEGC